MIELILCILQIGSLANIESKTDFIIPASISGIKLVEVENVFYYFSGKVGTYQYLQDLSYFSLENDSINFKSYSSSDSPYPRANYGLTAIENFQDDIDLIYLFGGSGNDGIFDDMWIFVPNIQRWYQSKVDGGIIPRFDHSFIIFNDAGYTKLAVFGGEAFDSKSISDLEIIILSFPNSQKEYTNIDFNKTCFNHGLTGSQIQFYNNSLYVFSGMFIDDNGINYYYNDICKFDLKSKRWSNISVQAKLPNSSYGGSAIKDNFLYYFFGKNDQEILKSVYRLDLNKITEGWVNISDNDIGCERFKFGYSEFVSNGSSSFIQFFGGSNNSHFLNTQGKIKLSDQKIVIECDKENFDFPDPRHSSGLVQLSNEIVLFGGKSTYTIYNDLWKKTSENKSGWELIKALGKYPENRYSHSTTSQGNFMIIAGGYNQYEELLSDFWILEKNDGYYIWNELGSVDSISPPPTSESCLVFDFPKFYQIGGNNEKSISNSVWKYDLTTSKFTLMKIDGYLYPVASHGCNLRKLQETTYIDIFFGKNSGNNTSSNILMTLIIVNETNAKIDRTKECESVQPISKFSYAVDKNYLYIAGGLNNEITSNLFKVIDLISLNLVLEFTLDKNIFSSSSTIFNGSFILFSGLQGYGYLSDSSSLSSILYLNSGNCSKGFYEYNSTCIPCNPGSFKSNSDEKCNLCEPGTFNNIYAATDRIQCIPCEFRSFSNTSGAHECLPCTAEMVCFVGSTIPIDNEIYFSNTQPDLIEPKVDNMFIIYILIACIAGICIFALIWVFSLKARILCTLYDLFYKYHINLKPKEYSYIGGFFTGFTALLLSGIFVYYLVSFIDYNIIETVLLVPSSTLIEKNGYEDEKINLYVEFNSLRGSRCEDLSVITESSSKALKISDKMNFNSKNQKDYQCILKFELKTTKFFSTGGSVRIDLNCTKCYTSDIIVAMEGRAAYHHKNSRYVQNLTLENGKVFIGSDPSYFYFRIAPAYFEDFSSEDLKKSYGYRISSFINPVLGSVSDTSNIFLSSGLSFVISLSLSESGIYTTSTRKLGTVEFLSVAISSLGGIASVIIVIMKFYEIIYLFIKNRKIKTKSEYKLELERKNRSREPTSESRSSFVEGTIN